MEVDFSDVKPSIMNWLMVGLLAVSFIVFIKFVVNKFDNPITNIVEPFVNAI